MSVELATDGHIWVFRELTDGRGFDVRDPRGGMGLSNMQARAAEVGGRFGVTARPGAEFEVPGGKAHVGGASQDANALDRIIRALR